MDENDLLIVSFHEIMGAEWQFGVVSHDSGSGVQNISVYVMVVIQ